MTKSTKRSKLKRAKTSAYYKKDWKTFWEIIELLRRKKVAIPAVMKPVPIGWDYPFLIRRPEAITAVVIL